MRPGILHVVIIVSHSCCGRRLYARARARVDDLNFKSTLHVPLITAQVIPANHISTVILITSDRSLCRFPTPSPLPPPSSRPTVLPRTRARARVASKLIYSQRAGIPTSSEAPPPPTGEYEGCREEVGGGGRREEVGIRCMPEYFNVHARFGVI